MSKKKKDWKTEKERLLRLDREERRKEYRRQDFTSLDKIPTWAEENLSNDKEEGKELTGGGGLSDKISLYKGDITVLEVDAIVNAANSSLLGGGGVDGCIHKAAGSCLYDECHSLNGCDTGKAKITCGYDLPARYVIHTVGPVARGHVGPTETNDLTSCYQNSLRLMKEHGLSTVAFPCISTGIYGFPNEPAADIALNTVKSWIEENPDQITRVIFCVFLETDFAIYKKKMSVIFQDNDMEVTEEQLKGGKEETGDEEEGDNGNEEPSQEKDNDENESQDKDEPIGIDKDKDEDKGIDNAKDEDGDKAEEEEPAAKTEDYTTTKSTMEMEDISQISDTGTSNGEEMKDHVKSSEDPNSIPTDSTQPKDTVEKKE
ncbi:ADP-ribose glycohydrolase MACROD2 isoform X7 [Micropterus dolomieu]|uniref:ADP-ribose glycohydrolase MACROD2 isoform X7 n=1 Tax=Micropterus dolomieu TaxID=147949 RepID=UPI001E8EE9EF|nr:ADP-ribose glycohydrolase MACROD2 isoform X7 [Micropterus dolomieu]